MDIISATLFVFQISTDEQKKFKEADFFYGMRNGQII